MNSDSVRESTAVVTGLGLVCIALFAGVSLYTHSPSDVMDYQAAASSEIQNKAGLLGAQIAHHALCLYGVGAWVITGLMLVFGSLMCALRNMSGFVTRGLGAVLLSVLVCAWVGAMDGPPGEYPAGPGGLVGGTFVAPALVGYFGRVGVFLLLATGGLVACLLLEQGITEALLGYVGRGVVRASSHFGNWVVGRMPSDAGSPASSVTAVPAPAPAMAATGRQPSVRMYNQPSAVPVIAPAPPPAQIALPRVEVFGNAPDTRKGRAPAAAEARPAPALPISPSTEPASNLPPPSPVRKTAPPPPSSLESAESAIPVNRIESEVESPKPEKADRKSAKAEKAEALAESDADESERRRQEALRQADVAETERLAREKEAREQYQREAKALEKLEKERAAQDEERRKSNEKFSAAIAAVAGKTEGESDPAVDGPTAEAGAIIPRPKRELPVNYELPKFELLIDKDITPAVTSESLKQRGATLIQTLWDFKIGARLAGIQSGPTVTMYELELDAGIKVQKVVGLQDNLAMALKAEHGVRIIAPIPGKSSIGIEIPNTEDHTLRMRPILESPQFRAKNWALPLVLGRDSVGNPLVADLATMPHLLIAGTTGSGKSVCVNSIILSLMVVRRPHEVKLILVDPKQVEMTDFKGIPHLLSPVVTDMKLAAGVLTWAVQKMEQRYERMSKVGVRNIGTWNKMTPEERIARLAEDEPQDDYKENMPYIVIIVDEFADLMMTAGKEIEQAIARLAQKARAAGIHVILATQRPSADVVTGLIKTNLPCRICFQVKSKIDSRIVLDQGGAEKLAGKGDMLFIGAGNSNLVRAKGVFIADDEIRSVVAACKAQAEPIYSEEVEQVAARAGKDEDDEDGPPIETNRQAIELDEKFDEGVEVFLSLGRASTSLLQRRMGLGYTRAAKLCDQMEARGIVGPDRGPKGRELLITQDQWDQFKRARQGAAAPKPALTSPPVASSAQPDPALLNKLASSDGTKPPEDDEAEMELE